MHPSLSRRHFFALIVPHCHRGRSVQKANKNTLLKGRPAKSARVKKPPYPNPFSPILPGHPLGLTMRPTILPNEPCLAHIGKISSNLNTISIAPKKSYIVVLSFDIFVFFLFYCRFAPKIYSALGAEIV